MPTRRDDIADLADIAGVPHVALGDDALDTLELFLGDALDDLPSFPGVAPDRDVVLTDGENTPLALVGADGVRAIRPFAPGGGPEWDPALRRPARDVATDLRRATGDGRVLGVVVDRAPTRDDLANLAEVVATAEPAAILCVVPVARARPRPGEMDATGSTRMGLVVRHSLASARLGLTVDIVVIPFPRGDRSVALDDVMKRYGVAESVWAGETHDALERAATEVYPDAVASEVIRAQRRDRGRGAMILFTGLSGSGKSTIARALADELRATTAHTVTLLDGDEVRRHLSSDLGFDAESRDRNIDRVAYVGSLIADHGGIAIAAPIAPFAAARRAARELVEAHGAFVLVFVDAPLEVCESRDRKGLYARARAGEIADFTGISSPYEVPDDADVRIDTTTTEVAEAVRLIGAALDARLDAADEADAADRD